MMQEFRTDREALHSGRTIVAASSNSSEDLCQDAQIPAARSKRQVKMTVAQPRRSRSRSRSPSRPRGSGVEFPPPTALDGLEPMPIPETGKLMNLARSAEIAVLTRNPERNSGFFTGVFAGSGQTSFTGADAAEPDRRGFSRSSVVYLHLEDDEFKKQPSSSPRTSLTAACEVIRTDLEAMIELYTYFFTHAKTYIHRKTIENLSKINLRH